MTHPRHRESRIAVYSLKRELGQALTLCRTTNNVTDLGTGRQTETLVKLRIGRAVLLPAKAIRDFAYDLSFIAANKNFTYGGFYDHRNRRVLIDRRDIARGDSAWPIDLNMHVILKDERWEVKEIYEYEDEEAILIILDGLKGAQRLDVIAESASDDAGLTDGIVDS